MVQVSSEGLGEPEIRRSGQRTAAPHRAGARQQLLAAEQAERLAQLGTDGVLPAFAPIEREVRDFGAFAADQDGEQLGVFVVRVGADDQDALVVSSIRSSCSTATVPPADGGSSWAASETGMRASGQRKRQRRCADDPAGRETEAR